MDRVFIHKKYNYITGDFDIAILELKKGFNFQSHLNIRPAVLPKSPLNSHKLHAAIGYIDSKKGVMLKQLNVSIWENDQCAYIREHGNPTENTLMCIEDVCCDGNALCDLCKVKSSKIKSISKSSNLIVDCFFHKDSDYVLYHVIGNNRIEILGFPKWCNRKSNYLNRVTSRMEERSAIVYTNIQHLLPWVQNILHSRCLTEPSSSIDSNQLDCDEYINSKF